jgi:hypothetical protein
VFCHRRGRSAGQAEAENVFARKPAGQADSDSADEAVAAADAVPFCYLGRAQIV